MKIYLNQTVLEAALQRIRWVFDEFEQVLVSFSGGKDSTVTLNLALQVAEEKGRLPLDVVFIDQEAEWQSVIDYVAVVMYDARVNPYWLQIPIRLFNSTSVAEPWLNCWGPGEKWMRERDPIAKTENVYGTDRFKPLFDAFIKYHWPDKKVCNLAGVRGEESPARMVSLTNNAKYKWATWGKRVNGKKLQHYTLYPLYDWSYTDIWKAIHDHHWPYCKIYDEMYRYGIPVHEMRVSNVHHETAVHSLYYLQEIEGETWSRLTERVQGINTAGQMKSTAFQVPAQLPPMFEDWREYRDYLLDNLVPDEIAATAFRHQFGLMDKTYAKMKNLEAMYKIQITAVLANDWHGTKLDNWRTKPEIAGWRRYNRTGIVHHRDRKSKFIYGNDNQ